MSWKLPRDWARREPEACAPPAPLVPGLGARLSFVLSRVPAGAAVVDVGTDHARLPAALLEGGRARRAIAIDANAEPLRRAEARAREAGVELRLGRGLEPLRAGEATVAIFAGLGGDLVARILEDTAPAPLGLERLVVQANTEHARVRRALHAAGYELREERHLVDERRAFLVMVAQRTAEPRALDEEAELLGPAWARREDALFDLWLKGQRRLLQRAMKAPSPRAHSPERALELIDAALARPRRVSR